jgi:demethylmenaquinone methyltransferase / 2-methoxy-6-polyprenyl-1,4-benzoquinol methylase
MAGENPSRDRIVQSMFDRIAARYDLLNRVISFRFDRRWRLRVIEAAQLNPGSRVLDLGTGTGDLLFEAAEAARGGGRLIGLDFAAAMLRLARAKRNQSALRDNTEFVLASAMTLPFKSSAFDCAITAFVLRNVSDLPLLFSEACRVLKPDGRFVSLDMFPPRARWFSALYSIYFHCLMPRIGGLLAQDRQAYQYLSDSVRRFHPPEHVSELIRRAGFEHVTVQKFLGGAVCMHIGLKRAGSRA